MPLVEEARGMKLQPDSLMALEDALQKANGWQARAERLFKGGEFTSLYFTGLGKITDLLCCDIFLLSCWCMFASLCFMLSR